MLQVELLRESNFKYPLTNFALPKQLSLSLGSKEEDHLMKGLVP